jgi:hypothetical protein
MIDSFRNTTTAVGNTQEDDEDDDVNNKGMINIDDHGDDFAMTEAMKQDIASWDVASEYVKSLGPLFLNKLLKSKSYSSAYFSDGFCLPAINFSKVASKRFCFVSSFLAPLIQLKYSF